MSTDSTLQQLWKRTVVIGECWCFVGAQTDGYGQIVYLKHVVYTHRLSAHIHLGFNLSSPLPICHKPGVCPFRNCWNPAHIYVGTAQRNVWDNVILHKRKTHCPRGHEYNSKNTAVYRGFQRCRICDRRRSLARYHRTKKTKERTS
jgi:hypothetical protein